MSGLSIEITTDEISPALASIVRRLNDPTPLMEEIGMAVAEDSRMNFIRQQDPWGRAWQPLSALTQRLRRQGRGAGANQILRDTNRLMNSITYSASRDSVQVGTNAIYAAIHQLGGTVLPKRGRYLWAGRPGEQRIPLKKAVIPARPYLPMRADRVDLPAALEQEVLEITRAFLGGEGAR